MSSSTNLRTLHVGQTVTFNVHLSGLESGQKFDSLATTIYYTDHLGTAVITPGVTPSGIIPSSGIFLFDGMGQATVSFLATGTDYILDNGLFFSFDTVVQYAGLGYLWFDYAAASQVNPVIYFSSSDEEHPLFCYCGTGNESVLEFNVVPEPSTLISLIAAGLSTAAFFLMRQILAALVQ